MDVPTNASNWLIKHTPHYIFNYKENTLAEKEIDEIMKLQESCFSEITKTLGLTLENPIQYYLCSSKKEVKEEAGLDYECSEVTILDDIENPVIFAVYSEDLKSIGAHEDVHAIASSHGQPNSIAVVEGLATCFDRTWRGVSNELCTYLYLEDGKYVSIADMIDDDDYFTDLEIDVSYPIMGAFTRYLMDKYGVSLYLRLYGVQSSWEEAFVELYGQTMEDVEAGFIETIRDTEYTEEELEESKKELYED